MQTEWFTDSIDFQPLHNREIRGMFDGGNISSDAGALLLREVENKTQILSRFAKCFTDYRDPKRTDHQVANRRPHKRVVG